MASPDKSASQGEGGKRALPAIALPEGGGAIRGIGEKFAANPVTGTGSTTIPLPTSAGRSGFGPELSLSYDSGSGNGPFGFGWSLSLASIARKTDKALPRYLDTEDSDDFILSGAEDLVPALKPDGTRQRDETTAAGYAIEPYRPRIEGLFARIERWTRSDGDVHWRSISKDNILTLYGTDANSRVADPEDPRRVFSWLICETRDDKGNAILYRYKGEDGTACVLARSRERNRGGAGDVRRTANRYLKRILYGNRAPLLDGAGRRPQFLADLPGAQLDAAGWMFELVCDYGEHHSLAPKPDDGGDWEYRIDAFSSYRSGFEVRTTRLCRRVLMFHHVPDAAGGKGYDGLVRSTDLTHSDRQDPTDPRNPLYTFLRSVTQTGHRRRADGSYESRSLPAVEFDYTEPVVQNRVELVAADNLENLPVGVDGGDYRWTDLHGEGIPGILAERAGAFFYKRNLSPIADRQVSFGPTACVAEKPNLTLAGGAQFMDLAGDGRPDLVVLDGPTPGFYEHDADAGWQSFRPFVSRLNRDTRDPSLRFIDLNGDGRADVLITEDDAFVWHPSLGEDGFGPARRAARALDEEKGPRLVFANEAEAIHLADMSGDGLTDLVRVRNGEVCYWPNLGHGRFGAKVAMDHPPHFDNPDQFDHRRLRLGDIDGTGTADLVYLHRSGVRLYFNQSGNGWSEGRALAIFPRVDELASIELVDLLGNGTTCLVWSSPLPGDAGRPMRYVNLMGAHKPHLLVRTANNLGAETVVRYAPSTRFYLQDERDGRPWLTKLPFPVHVVERVDTIDHIARNRFVTRYAYHHGHFDGEEREFRGFGMVEQWDTEELAALTADGALPAASNLDPASHVPPVLTRTWFHTGLYLGRERVSDYFAGFLAGQGVGEYYREPPSTSVAPADLLLADTVLPPGLTVEEEREACRALKGSMLRQEIYARDGAAGQDHPYSVVEQNFGVRREQPRGGNRHGVFFTHARETITYHYERDPADPRVQHALTLEVDAFGNVLKEAAVGYGRRHSDPTLPLQSDSDAQTMKLVTYSEHRFTSPIEGTDIYRAPLPCETRTFELTGYAPTGPAGRFRDTDLVQIAGNVVTHRFQGEVPYEAVPAGNRKRRLIEHVRTLYRADDLTRLLPLGTAGRLALPGESYQLASTPGLLAEVYKRGGQALLPNPAQILGGAAGDRGGYLPSQVLKADLRFPTSDPDDHWWIPAGTSFLSPNAAHTPAQELAYARAHFYLPLRMRDPFQAESLIAYDAHDLLPVETRDAAGNRISAGLRRPDGTIDPTVPGNDYRVLQPALVTDPNRNRRAVAFDALGMVAGTAVMGKAEESLGDSLAGFIADLAESDILAHLADPLDDPHALLGGATSRLVYDLFAYHRTRQLADPRPPAVCTMARETHAADLATGVQTKVQQSFSYSDGFGREIQKKIQAEPGPVAGSIADVNPRWVGSGWTIFNNKGKPVRQYEPFFSATHGFEFGILAGVSPILFYDPLGRVVATLHPDHSYEKVTFGPWRQESSDRNDTVLADPRTDVDVAGYVAGHFAALGLGAAWQTWHAERDGGALGAEAKAAADKAAAHAGTPTIACFDTLGRTFLTLADNGPDPSDTNTPKKHLLYATRVELDIEGNQRAVRDAIVEAGDPRGRIVMRYAYDMLGHRIRQESMEAGARWTLSDAAGKPLRAWDSRGHDFATDYDVLRRPLRTRVTGADPALPGQALLTERIVYGEQHPQAEARNLKGKAWLHLDQAGGAAAEAHDFKGNPVSASRRLTGGTRYRQAVDWTAVDADPLALPPDAAAALDPLALDAALAPFLDPDAYSSLTAYVALNRPTELTTPHTPAMAANVIRPGYNEANLLERVDVNLRGALDEDGGTVWTRFVADIDYDAKCQRERIEYGNKVVTLYEHDPLTHRLTRLLTRRDAGDFPADCPQPAAAGWPGCQVQDLRYTYDAVGNITHIEDRAQQAIFFANSRVDPSADYSYDPLYRLIAATGREHLGQNGDPIAHSPDDAQRRNLPQPGDGFAMGRYLESYVYDAAGNLSTMQHTGANPLQSGWTRTYSYAEASLIEPAKTGNRLTQTKVGASPAEVYVHDAHGNMMAMPHLAGMGWDTHDQLAHVDLGGGGEAFYVYDSGGQRVRKVWEKSAALIEERIYLGGFEIFRRRQGADLLERETLHVMAATQRVALVETRTLDTSGSDPAPSEVIRYQIGNHLGSAAIELDDEARIVSYEEYGPYGDTTFQAVRSQTESPKRYGYSGKERDEESGLYYHGARHYAAWLGRWSSADPALFELFDSSKSPEKLRVSLNSFTGMDDNPVMLIDPDGRQSGFGTRLEHSTPEQSAKITQGSKEFMALPRVSGALQVIGAVGEFIGAAALILTPEPTMVTKVTGWALAVHGADTFSAGLSSLYSGEVKKTLTEQGSTEAGRQMGMPENYAQGFGAGVDFLAAIGPSIVGSMAKTSTTLTNKGLSLTSTETKLLAGETKVAATETKLASSDEKLLAGAKGDAGTGATKLKKGGAAPVDQGKAAVEKVKDKIKSAGGTVHGEEISLKTQHGRRKMDIFATDVNEFGEFELFHIEVKSGKSPYTKIQKLKDIEIQEVGCVTVGKKAKDIGWENKVIKVRTKVIYHK